MAKVRYMCGLRVTVVLKTTTVTVMATLIAFTRFRCRVRRKTARFLGTVKNVLLR